MISGKNPSQVLKIVASANLIYFAIELYFAIRGHSVSLFAESIDFFEDAVLNLLAAIGLLYHAHSRARLARALALIVLLPTIGTLWILALHLIGGGLPNAKAMTGVGLGALVVNSTCALLSASIRDSGGALTKAAYLSARNDVLANVAMITAGIFTLWSPSYWPDATVGIAIGILNADAGKKIWNASRLEV